MTHQVKIRLIAVILAFMSSAFFAEDLPGIDEDVPPPPVVSQLSAKPDGGDVLLAWEPVAGITGTSIILRSDRPVTAANYLSVQRIAELPYTQTSYRDTPETPGPWYYAVLSVDENGTNYDFFLPASNSMLVPVLAESKAPELPVTISGFDTVTRNDAVIATWNSSRSGKNLVVYRSTRPFTGTDSLVSAILVATIPDDGTPFVDYPVPGVPCYYAVIDEPSLRSGSPVFVPGENTNRIPVEISAQFSRIQRGVVPPLRSMPLPWLNPGNQPRRQALTFSKKTERLVANIVSLSRKTVHTERVPYVFTMDLNTGSGGESLALRTILEKTFFPGNWDEAVEELQKFLAIRRTPETAARARFYIGEARYFTGKYPEALLEFLLAQDRYYNQSKEWIQYTLDKMVEID